MTTAKALSEELKKITGPVYEFRHGGIAAFNNGAQVAELQVAFPILWARHAEQNGYDADGLTIKLNQEEVRLFRTDDDWNFEVI